MKVLITGATGFVGSHLVDYLSKLPNIEIWGTKRRRSPLDNLQSPVNLIDCEITDYFNVTNVIGDLQPDRIFHLAAQSFVPLSWRAPDLTIQVNVLGTLNLLEAVRNLSPSTRVLIAGSSEEYGLVKPEECPITEDQPFRPQSPYAVSKVAMELLALQYVASYGLHIVTTRAFNHTGPRRGEHFVESSFCKQIALIEKGKQEPFILCGNLDAQRDYTDVRDIVKAYWLALEKCPPGEPFNICSGRVRSVRDLYFKLVRMTNTAPKVRQKPELMRPSDVPLLQGSYAKFKALTGWKPEIDWSKTLNDLLKYWREKV